MSKESFMVFAVSVIVHSFIDGIVIGVFNEFSKMAILTVCVIIQKMPVSYSFGVAFSN